MDSPPDFKTKLSPIHLTVSSTPKSNCNYTVKPRPAKLSVVDFDLNEPCRYFKSSFARSLSYNQNQSASLDFTINEDFLDTGTDALPAAGGGGSMAAASDAHSLPIVHRRKPSCWTTQKQESTVMDNTQTDMNDCTRRPFAVPENSTNVEAVILQNQVDTLQWQLKQVETNCDMYRAVMEEVGRFFERFQINANSAKIEQISRSKSMHYVNGYDTTKEESMKSPRTRSSTNLIDLKKLSPPHAHPNISEDECNATTYNTFKDFTWRRSPKSALSPKSTTLEQDSDKLLHEAFRLSRTIKNLMNTQQPDLTQHRNGGEPTLLDVSLLQPVPKPLAKKQATQHDVTDTFSRIFMRKMNMRDSRQSVRSSTGSSVHSTSSSSKPETDDETNYSPPINKPLSNICSSATEDESGFSSISSFQEIGLPMNSTMLSNAPPSLRTSAPTELLDDFGEVTCIERNATLKPMMHTPNTIGLPIMGSSGEHGRWDTLPAAFKRNRYQRFSTLSHDDTATVLWV